MASAGGRRAIIVGGGIAGPVLAMFLRKAGLEPVVYEGRAEPDDHAGYFLNLAPNGLAVLGALGLKEEVLGYGTPTTSIVFQNHRGRKLGELSESTLLIKRGLLNGALRDAAMRRGVPVELDKRLKGVEILPDRGVIARFEDGSEAEGDLLFGCDGIHSRTRRSIMPDAPEPRYSGLVDSGGYASAAGIPPSDGVMRMTFGTEGFFGYQVVPSGEAYWFENFHQESEPDRRELEAIPDGRWREKLLGLHRRDLPVISEIIGSTGVIGRWANYELPSLPSWHEGPVCLIGDAAHAMLPSAGQGASMAMEDAMVLAKCLRDFPIFPKLGEAFSAFELLRRDRVEHAAGEARKNGSRKAPTNTLPGSAAPLSPEGTKAPGTIPFPLRMYSSRHRRKEPRVEWCVILTS